jgi:hypothetical protein
MLHGRPLECQSQRDTAGALKKMQDWLTRPISPARAGPSLNRINELGTCSLQPRIRARLHRPSELCQGFLPLPPAAVKRRPRR